MSDNLFCMRELKVLVCKPNTLSRELYSRKRENE